MMSVLDLLEDAAAYGAVRQGYENTERAEALFALIRLTAFTDAIRWVSSTVPRWFAKGAEDGMVAFSGAFRRAEEGAFRRGASGPRDAPVCLRSAWRPD